MFDSIFYITGIALTKKGETCKERGWLPISSLADCKASEGYLQDHYPSYKFVKEEDVYYLPKGCYVYDMSWYPDGGYHEGYFNTHDSGRGDSDSTVLCTTSEGEKS